MSRWMVALGIVAMAILAIGCAGGAQPVGGARGAGADFPMAVTDDAQRTVTIEKKPERIVSIASSNTELVYALGLQDRLVGVDDYSDYPPEAKKKDRVGGFSRPNMERLVEMAPDLVLATNIHVKTVVPELEKRGLTVVVFQPPTLEGVLVNLQVLGRMGGQTGAADRVTADLTRRIEAVAGKTRGLASRPRVFFELSPDLISAGPDTFVDDLIALAGGDNIARGANAPWPKLNPENIVLKDPEVIVLSDHGSDAGGVTVEMVRARPGWGVISAVNSGRIVPLTDRDIVNRPGPRAVDGLEFLARTFHPQLFK